MRNDILTIDQIEAETSISLGGSSLDIELTPADYRKCIADAVRAYSRVLPMRRCAALTVSSSVKRYELAAAAHPRILGIVDVQFTVQGILDSRVDPFSQEDMSIAGLAAMGGETFWEITQRKTYLKDAQRVVSAEAEWTAEWEGDGKYYLYIDVTHNPTQCTYWWTSTYSVDNHAITGMQWIPEGDTEWIMDFTLARAKQILSRVRGKFQGIATPEGGSDPVDFSELMQEGREDEQALNEELNLRRRTISPNIG